MLHSKTMNNEKIDDGGSGVAWTETPIFLGVL
jgi:hypothetical protein